MILCGGSDSVIILTGVGGFIACRAVRSLSQRNNEPTRASRPWDSDRDGFVMGEGAGVLLLEELEHAKSSKLSSIVLARTQRITLVLSQPWAFVPWMEKLSIEEELGKGNQELAEDMAITQHSRNRRIKGGTLIVCPMALLGQWKDELEAHSKPDSISVFVHYGGDISKP
nr:3-oxoacyl-[acyl-carrier-protein] synthase II, chloroplastic [Ipomoea batatas]